MSLIYKNLTYIIIAALVVIIFLQRACTDTSDPVTDVSKVTIDKKEYELLLHKRDTFYVTETFYVKGDPIPGKIIYKDVPADVDTTAILRDYFALHPYEDFVKIQKEGDSTNYGDLTVTEVITQNKSVGRKYNFNIKIPTYTETFVVKELPKTQVYIGGGMNFDKVNILNGVYGGLLLKTKKDHIYGLNLGITNNGQEVTPFVGGSMYWKIRFKKQTTQYSKLEVQAAQQILNNLTN